MFSRNQATPKAAPKAGKAGQRGLSFFGAEVVISGDVATTSQLHVDGRVDGSVRCAQLCQGGGGVIAGDIVADEARIGGLVQGTVNAATLVIEASARVTGDVTYETITIAAGARIDGRLARRDSLASTEGLIATPKGAEMPALPSAGSELFPRADLPRVAVG
ncbi:MAG: bactofilin family protein [Allosphingosinicella sp.]